MKFIILFALVFSGCSTQRRHYLWKYVKVLDAVPATSEKLKRDLKRCLLHVNDNKIKIVLDSDAKKESYCGCMLFGFLGIHNFLPFVQDYDNYLIKEAEFNKDDATFLYNSMMTEQVEFNQFDAAVNASTSNPEMYKKYLKKYDQKVNFCGSIPLMVHFSSEPGHTSHW